MRSGKLERGCSGRGRGPQQALLCAGWGTAGVGGALREAGLARSRCRARIRRRIARAVDHGHNRLDGTGLAFGNFDLFRTPAEEKEKFHGPLAWGVQRGAVASTGSPAS